MSINKIIDKARNLVEGNALGAPTKAEVSYVADYGARSAIDISAKSSEFMSFDADGDQVMGYVAGGGRDEFILEWVLPKSKADFIEALGEWTWRISNVADDRNLGSIKFDEMNSKALSPPLAGQCLFDEDEIDFFGWEGNDELNALKLSEWKYFEIANTKDPYHIVLELELGTIITFRSFYRRKALFSNSEGTFCEMVLSNEWIEGEIIAKKLSKEMCLEVIHKLLTP